MIVICIPYNLFWKKYKQITQGILSLLIKWMNFHNVSISQKILINQEGGYKKDAHN